ncbi:MAG TPA: NTP transferase domain-containing protein [Thermoleophilaceae bacterium]|nr:NTP transferase domain-containing protein [Thermoleophilaceae bacterium]
MTSTFTGIVLGGGLGRRMGAPKATALLGGRPLIAYPLEALHSVCDRVVVVAKRDTQLPADLERWDEPDEPRHPIAGLRHALERCGGPIVVCAADMPFVSPDALQRIAASLGNAAAAVARADDQLQPLLAAYAPQALATLAAAPSGDPLRRTVESLAPVVVDVPPEVAFNVNTPDELAEAERRLRSERA